MRALVIPFTARFITLTLCIAATAACVGVAMAQSGWLVPLAVPISLFGALSLLGLRDLVQTRHAVLRNYPISAHLRFLLERDPAGDAAVFLRERDGRHAVHRDQRAVVYQRAKMALDKRPFGTQFDVYAHGFEWLRHSIAAEAGRRRRRSASRSAGRIAPSPIRPRSSTSRP